MKQENDRDRRAKLSHDPNNTAWSRLPKKYGEKILIAQGWKPGLPLGLDDSTPAKNASSQSYVNLVLKGDNLGIGAKNKPTDRNVQSVGMDAFQGLLGRLNGRDDALLSEQGKAHKETKRKLYVQRRWGPLCFVSGGLLVGDRSLNLEEHHPSCPREKSDTSRRLVKQGSVTKQNGPTSRSCNSKESLAQPEGQVSEQSRQRILKEHNTSDVLARDTTTTRRAPTFLYPSPSTAEEETQAWYVLEQASRRLRRKNSRLGKSIKGTPPEAATSVAKTPKLQLQMPDISNPKECDLAGQVSKLGLKNPETVQGRQAVRKRYIQQKRISITDRRALNEVRPDRVKSLFAWALTDQTVDFNDTSMTFEAELAVTIAVSRLYPSSHPAAVGDGPILCV